MTVCLSFLTVNGLNCKQAIPFSLTRCLQRICSTENALENHTQNLIENLVQRGYDRREVQKEIDRARTMPREECLTPKQSSTADSRIPLIVTYHPFLPNFAATLRQHHDLLNASDRLGKVFPELPLAAYRRPKTSGTYSSTRLQPRPKTSSPLVTTPCGTRPAK